MTSSPTYYEALRHSHQADIRVSLYTEDVLVGEVPVANATLVIDAAAEVRRTADIVLGVDWWESETRALVEQANIQSGQVKIEHGVQWDTLGGVEWVQMGYLRIHDLTHTASKPVRQIQAYDRAVLLQEHQLPTGRPLNKPYVELIEDMLHETLPGEPLHIGTGVSMSAAPAVGHSLAGGANRLTEMIHLAEALGAVLSNDEKGAFHLDAYAASAASVWDVNAGHSGVLIDATETFSRQEQYNAVGIEWTPNISTEDWRKYIYLWDNDPTSPTFYDGPFGKRNRFFQEEYDYLLTTVEAETLARRKLAEHSGATRALSLTSLYNPTLQPGQRITVTLPDQTPEQHIVDVVEFNLGGDASMRIGTRLQRSASVFRSITT